MSHALLYILLLAIGIIIMYHTRNSLPVQNSLQQKTFHAFQVFGKLVFLFLVCSLFDNVVAVL